MEENKDTLTEEQIDKIADAMFSEEEAKPEVNEEVVEPELKELTKMDTDAEAIGVRDSIVESDDDIIEAFSSYDIKESEIEELLKLIKEIKEGNDKNLYSRCPNSIKHLASSIAAMDKTPGDRMSILNGAAHMIIDSIISDAKLNAAFNEYNSEISKLIVDSNEEFNNLLSEGMSEVFNDIENIRETDPERADLIEGIKKSFESCDRFEREIEFAKNTPAKKITKWTKRVTNEAIYFNKRVNSNNVGIIIRDIESIVPIIHKVLPDYSIEEINRFIIVLSHTIGDVDDIVNVAYIYRMVSEIQKYEFIDLNEEKVPELFLNISKVIDESLI